LRVAGRLDGVRSKALGCGGRSVRRCPEAGGCILVYVDTVCPEPWATGSRVRARHPCIQVLGGFEQLVWEDPLDEIGVARGAKVELQTAHNI